MEDYIVNVLCEFKKMTILFSQRSKSQKWCEIIANIRVLCGRQRLI